MEMTLWLSLTKSFTLSPNKSNGFDHFITLLGLNAQPFENNQNDYNQDYVIFNMTAFTRTTEQLAYHGFTKKQLCMAETY